MPVPGEAVDLAKRFEGLRLDAYYDPVGFPTQGYGHLLSRETFADLSRWPRIEQKQADDWLEFDLDRAARAVRRLITVPLTRGQYAALIDFTFNIGSGNLEISTLRRVINRGDYDEAPQQFMRWVYAGGIRLAGLVRRRAEEVRFFLLS